MPSTVKREGVYCEKQGGGCQKNTMARVRNSSVASNAAVFTVA